MDAASTRQEVAATCIAFAAGFADAVVYKRYGLFAANMTGNLVLFGIRLAQHDMRGAAPNAAAIAAFLIGVIVARLLLRRWRMPMPALLTSAVVLALAALWPPSRPLLGIAMLAGAMGIANAAQTRYAGVNINTVFVTGDLQRVGQALADRTRDSLRTAATVGAVIVAYGGGAFTCVLAGALDSTFLLLPAALLILTIPLTR